MQKSPVTEVDNPSQIAWQGPGLKLGLFLPHSGPLASARFLKEVAVEAEQLGFTALWVADGDFYIGQVYWLGLPAAVWRTFTSP